MTIKKLIFFTLGLVALLSISSCGSKDKSNKNSSKISNTSDEFHQISFKSNKLLFKRYDLGADSNRIEDLNNVVWNGLITSPVKLAKFNALFSKAKNTGYYCCPKTHYTIAFYKDSTQLGLYSVDTSDYKDKVILFGQSFQTTYVINLKDFQSIILNK